MEADPELVVDAKAMGESIDLALFRKNLPARRP
jgi:hypothetical protein